jgi:hypothetical protein
MGALESIKILSKDELENVRAYVSKAKSLPLDSEGVEKILSKEKSDLLGITNKDVIAVFNTVSDHAYQWSNVEYYTRKAVEEVWNFAHTLTVYLKGVVPAIEGMPGYKDYTIKIKGLTEEQINELGPVFMNKEDIEGVHPIKSALNSVSNSVALYKDSFVRGHEYLSDFKDTMDQKVVVAVGRVLKLDTLKEVQTELEKLKGEIKEVQAERDDLLSRAHFNPQVFQKSDNEAYQVLLENRRNLEEQIENGKVLTGALENFHDELVATNVHLVKASRELLRITGKFIDVKAFIDSSKTKIDGVKEFHSLRRFVLDVTGVSNDWLKIENDTRELMDVLRP